MNLIVCDILIRIFVIEKMVKSAHTSDDELRIIFFVISALFPMLLFVKIVFISVVKTQNKQYI